jgi:hypothetical protein
VNNDSVINMYTKTEVNIINSKTFQQDDRLGNQGVMISDDEIYPTSKLGSWPVVPTITATSLLAETKL